MQKIDMSYNAVGVIKSQLCVAIAKSEKVRNAIGFTNSENTKDYDESDPLTLINTCIKPFLQYPDTITSTDPIILVGVNTSENSKNPYLTSASVTIVCVIDSSDMATTQGYFRKDLAEKGCVCYTKTDLIADEIIKAVSEFEGTWIGEIENIKSEEYALNSTRYCRSIVFRLKDVNLGKLMQHR